MTEEVNSGGESAEWTREQIMDVLKAVVDPEVHINIVDMGLVYEVEQQDKLIHVQMTLTSPGCPYGPYLLHQVKDTLKQMKGIEDATIEVVWEPIWGPEKMSEEAKLELGFEL